MEPRLIKTDIAEYQPARYDGQNRSGIKPIGDHVLVLTDQVSDQTRGGVHLPETVRERQDLAAETGIIVELGDDAFYWNADRTRQWQGSKPKVGDHVYIQRYAGRVFDGDDGQKYRVISDTCVAAVRKEPAQQIEEKAA